MKFLSSTCVRVCIIILFNYNEIIKYYNLINLIIKYYIFIKLKLNLKNKQYYRVLTSHVLKHRPCTIFKVQKE